MSSHSQPHSGQAEAVSPIVDPLWPGPSLFVPAHLECLLVGEPNRTRGTFADLRIDYRQVEKNADPEKGPFQTRTDTDRIGLGAHLQITLPSGFREAPPQNDGKVQFPAIPNRWVVTRSVVTAPGEPPALTLWVLQSDYVGPQLDAANSYPNPNRALNTIWVGRRVSLAAWNNPPGPTQPLLRAVAPGTISWIMTPENTRDALSFHDGLKDVAAGALVSYSMLGWYRPASFDPLLGVTASEPDGFLTDAAWHEILSGLRLDVGGAAGLAAAELAWSTWLAAHPISGGPMLPEVQKRLAGQSLCHGMVFGIEWKGPSQLYPVAPVFTAPAVTVAVGGTAMEALAAWLADVLKQPVLEDLILALQQGSVFDYLNNRATFQNQALAARFANNEGGTVWLVTPPEGDQAPRGETLQTVPLDPDQTRALTRLNADQAALDAADRAIAGHASELFALVFKQVRLAQDPFAPPARKKAVTDAIAEEKRILQGLSTERDGLALAVAKAKTTLLGLLREKFVLAPNHTARFHPPGPPALLVAGAHLDTRLLPPGDDGGAEDSLFCRFTGQTVASLTVLVNGGEQTIDASALVARGVKLPDQNAGLPKELGDYLVETLLFDTANARFLAVIAFRLAGVTPSPAQLDALTATIRKQQTAPWNAGPFSAFDEAFLGQAVGFSGVVPLKRAVLPWAPPWTPLYLDWEIAWYPTSITPAGMFTNWALDGFEYRWNGTAIDTTPAIFTGRSVLGTQIADGLAQQLADFTDPVKNPNIDRLPINERRALTDAADKLANADIVTEAMSAFGSLLLMRDPRMTELISSDPVIQGYTAKAASLISLSGATWGFQPLRSGHFVLRQLWVVDAFGQILRTTNAGMDVLPIRSKSVMTPNQGGDRKRFVQVPPAVPQGSRLGLELLDAKDDAVPSNSSSLTSPVSGWLLPNHLNNSVQVFDATGAPLGEILPVEIDSSSGSARSIRWDPAPGLNLPYGGPPAIENPHLLGFVQGLLAQGPVSGDQALRELLDLIDLSLWRSPPQQQPAGTNLIVLAGQPVAVVRARIGLALDGPPALNQTWDQTGKQNDGGLTKIPVTVHLGDIAYDGNGALGYFLNNDYLVLNAAHGFDPALSLVREAVADRSGDRRTNLALAMARLPGALANSTRGVSDYMALNPTVTLYENGPSHLLTVLMDPRGTMPAISGVLPAASVALPPGSVAAMNTLRVNFRVGPVMVDPEQVRMPLPGNVAGNWGWIARSGVTLWETVAGIKSNEPKATFPSGLPALREGWLSLVPPPRGDAAARARGPQDALSLANMRFHERRETMSASIEAIPTEYDYEFLPKTMFVLATADATLTITNADRDPPPQEERSIAVRIPVGGENGLVDTLLGTTVSTSNPKWLATTFWNEPIPYVLLSGPALEPFTPLIVTFSTLHVSRLPGPVALEARELFGPQGSKALPVIKQLDGLKINLIYVNPGTVTDGDQTTLLWDVSGGAYVMIRPGEIKRPVSGGRFTDSLKMDVLAPQTTYTLELWTNDRQFVTSQATADVGRVTAGLTATPPGPVDVDTQTTLTWTSGYARIPILLSTPKTVFREPKTSGSRPVKLGDFVTGNQPEIPFELSADGYPQAVTRRVAVRLNKVRVRWLRYTDPAKTQFNFAVVNNARPGWPRTTTTDKLTTLRSDGPGGPVVAYLGTGPELQVQYMSAAPDPAKPGDTVTVTYETLNAVRAKLAVLPDTAGKPVPLTDQKGTAQIVAPAASATLVLTVTNANGSVSSEFDLVVQAT